MRRSSLLFSSPLLLALATGSCAMDTESPVNEPGDESHLVDNHDGQNAALMAVGRLDWNGRCTASFVDFGGGDEAPAYLLSAGHCGMDWSEPTSGTDVIIDSTPDGEARTVTFNYFADVDTRDQIVVEGRSAKYVTMKGRDLAILELASTVGELRDAGVEPLSLAATVPDELAPISWVGAPAGFPRGEDLLRLGTCTLGARRQVLELRWNWYDMLQTDCPDILPSSSGSPVFDESDQMFAVMTTSTIGAISQNCYLGHPCDVSPDGVKVLPATSYAVDVTSLQGCFVDGIFDVTAKPCDLDRGDTASLGNVRVGPRLPVDDDGQLRTWGATIDLPLLVEQENAHVRVKVGLASDVDCRDEDGYGKSMLISEQPLRELAGPAEEGVYTACLVTEIEGESQSFQRPFVVPLTIDTTPPTLAPRILTVGGLVQLVFAIPEIGHYDFWFGEPGSEHAHVDCNSDDVTLEPYRRQPLRTEFPVQLCVRAEDVAGNQGPMIDLQLTE